MEPDAHARFTSLSRDEYASHDVPPTALAACTGWWAGAGEDFFVTRHGRRLDIYRRLTDEQLPQEPYRLVRSVALR
jgi:hypothetical protein